jgi:hypothetical protein
MILNYMSFHTVVAKKSDLKKNLSVYIAFFFWVKIVKILKS